MRVVSVQPTSLLTLLLLTSILLCWSLTSQAMRYEAGFNHAEWRLELSPFECRMWQPIPYFGDAVFSNRAGEQQRFFLQPTRKAMKPGHAMIISQAPLWDESRQPTHLGSVEISTASTPVSLDQQRAYELLNELYKGMSPVFQRNAWYSEAEKIELALSSVNFRKAYSQYRDCLAALLPVNFEQINRSRIHFPTAKWELTASARRTLDHVVAYVKADTTVNGFYIDGHTDNVGRRLANLELSKKRAESVSEYLVANGVDPSMITTRYHGERYPVVDNRTAANRAANRRVTLRLERDFM